MGAAEGKALGEVDGIEVAGILVGKFVKTAI